MLSLDIKNKYMEAMLTRKSTRVYLDKQITKEQLDSIKAYLSDESNYASPFGSTVKMELVLDGKNDIKASTKNAPLYVVVIIENNNNSLVDAGYVFEKFILFVESLGLGTCYLNSGFKRDSVNIEYKLKSNEEFILASPIGFKSTKKSLIDRGGKIFFKSDSRKEIDEMFYSTLNRDAIEDESVRKMLEYVRWAPSAINKQPWRIILDGDKAHFYIDKKLNTSSRAGYCIHKLDVGIAMLHYAIVFEKEDFYLSDDMPTFDDMEYLISVQ